MNKLSTAIITTAFISIIFSCTEDEITSSKSDPLNLILNVQDVSAYGASDGAIYLTVEGGTSPYTYLWSNGATTEDIFNLTADEYSVIVTDANQQTAHDTATVNEPPLTLIEKLKELDSITISEITPQNGYPRQFEIHISQPLDHNNPNGIRFHQRIYLSHRDTTAPMVFMPSGYSNRATLASELGELFNGNQIYVAHRFMLGAEPSIMDWEYLTVEQAAADFHRIVEMFKTIYPGKWISYGASKNGDTALFHRSFYPDDVEATVVKVAPISFATEDPRYDSFLSTVGTQEIREKIKRFQIELLENRSDIIPMLQDFMDNSSYTFSISPGEILEYETLEYPFAFWQYGVEDIANVPDTGNTAEELFNILVGWRYINYYSDEYMNFYKPFWYQMYTELGYYRLIDDHLSHLTVDLPTPSYSAFAPRGVTLNFDPSTMIDINGWLQSEGNNIIYIYGELDPWTAGAIESTGSTNSIKLVQRGANHSIPFNSLDQETLVYSTLENWLNLSISKSTLSRYNLFDDKDVHNRISEFQQ